MSDWTNRPMNAFQELVRLEKIHYYLMIDGEVTYNKKTLDVVKLTPAQREKLKLDAKLVTPSQAREVLGLHQPHP